MSKHGVLYDATKKYRSRVYREGAWYAVVSDEAVRSAVVVVLSANFHGEIRAIKKKSKTTINHLFLFIFRMPISLTKSP